MIRADANIRETPATDIKTLNAIADLYDVKFEQTSFGLAEYSDMKADHLKRLADCKAKQCIFGIQSSDERLRIIMSALPLSSATVVHISPDLVRKKESLIDCLNVISGFYSSVSSTSISEEGPTQNQIARDRSIPKPPLSFPSGMEWFVRIGPQAWQKHYSEAVMLAAPCHPRKLAGDFMEWQIYADPPKFDVEAVKENRAYFAQHRLR